MRKSRGIREEGAEKQKNRGGRSREEEHEKSDEGANQG